MSAAPTRFDELARLAKELQRAERAAAKACEARASLPPGSSRARVTTANAKWRTKAEARDRAQEAYLVEHSRLFALQGERS